MNYSLRRRIVLSCAIAITAVCILACAAIYVSLRMVLVNEFDAALHVEAEGIKSMVESSSHGVHLEGAPSLSEPGPARAPFSLFQIQDEAGNVLVQSARWATIGKVVEPAADNQIAAIPLPKGGAARELAIRFKPRIDEDDVTALNAGLHPTYRLIVMRETTRLDRTMHRVGWVCICVGGALIAGLLALISLLVYRGFSAVNRLCAKIVELHCEELDQRLPLTDMPTELLPVATRLNELMDRIQASFQRERAITADAAHELRTPLAGLISTLEVAASRQRNSKDYLSAIHRCLEVAFQLRTSVADMLMLARLESNGQQVEAVQVDVAQMIHDIWDDLLPEILSRKLMTSLEIQELCVVGDPRLLKHVLDNLIGNAVSHCDSGGTIEISGRVAHNQVQLTIANSGSKVASDQVQNVFTRFWRADQTRGGQGRHSGLGLTLCKSICEVIRARLAVESSLDGDFIVRLSLPNAINSSVLKQTAESAA